MQNFVKYLTLASLLTSTTLSADTIASEYSLFKRIISPAMNWGENGVMLVPKAQPIGKGVINVSATSVDAGQINGDKLYLTTGTLMIGTSSDIEFGISKRTFIWESGERSDIDMDTVHLKARIFQLTDYYTPQISIGVNGASLKENQFNEKNNVLFNPYIVATLPIRVFTDNFLISVTGAAERVYVNDEKTETFFSAGADMVIAQTLYLTAEAQGLGQDEQDPIYNIGAKLKIGYFSIGAGLFNISEDKIESRDINSLENKEQYWMANVSLEIPLLDIFGGKDKKEAPVKEEGTVNNNYYYNNNVNNNNINSNVNSQFNSHAERREYENTQFNKMQGE